MREILSNNTNAIIGIIGTLLGVILGAVINQIYRYGSLKLYPKNFRMAFLKRSESGHYSEQNKIDSDTESVTIYFDLDLYNSSSEQKIGRETLLVLLKDGKEKKEVIKDLSTRRPTSYSFKTDQLESFNIPPKTLENLKLEAYFKKEDLSWMEGSIFLFEYKDHKNKIKRKKLNTLS